MKKLISLLVIFSLVLSMGMITVNADAGVTYTNMNTLNSATGYPTDWTGAGTNTSRVLGQGKLTETDNVLTLTKADTNTLFNIRTGVNVTSEERKIHITTMISAKERN